MGSWRFVILVVLASALLQAQAAAAAKVKPLKGIFPLEKKNSLRLVAVSNEGKAVLATFDAAGLFALQLTPGKTYTLSLLNSAGTYFGPVQCRPVCKRAKQCGEATQVVMTFKAKGNLGLITVQDGYATIPRGKWGICDQGAKKILARAVRGVVVGTGTFGLVKSPSAKAAAAVRADAQAPGAGADQDPLQPGGDQDGDGIIGAFDVDDNGNGVVDNVDGRQAMPVVGESFYVFSNLKVELNEASNVYSNNWDPAAAEKLFTERMTLAIQNQAPPGTSVTVTEARLNCNGLTYCSPKGTGKWVKSYPGPVLVNFPDDAGYDEAAGGGLMQSSAGMPDFQLKPYTTFDKINAGDTFIATAKLSDGSSLVLPGVLNFVFKTTPLVLSYSVNGGAEIVLTYPAAKGSMMAPIPVNGTDIRVRVTVARPQRAPIGNETAPNGWIDIGGMTWQAFTQTDMQGMHACKVDTYSSEQATKTADGWMDKSADAPTGTPKSSPASPMTFDVDMTGCAASGDPFKPGSSYTWTSGATGCLAIVARSFYSDNGEVSICFIRS